MTGEESNERNEGNTNDMYGDDDDNIDEDDIMLTVKPGENLLFIYQSAWQKRLLLRYGNELSLLDATYRTTKYALPLFFIVVKTNINYQIVATFVTESESVESISEALEIIKEWNPDYHPRYFMTDYSREEITALENVFPGEDPFRL